MKRRLFVLTILCLLLAGCARETPAETPPPQTEAAPIAVTPPAGLYDPDSALERQYNGALLRKHSKAQPSDKRRA